MIGPDIGEVEPETYWIFSIRQLRERGLRSVRLCVSDEDPGLKTALERVGYVDEESYSFYQAGGDLCLQL